MILLVSANILYIENFYEYFLPSDCTCNADGSDDETCNDEGKCTCKDKYAGDRCDKCLDDSYEFPGCNKISESSLQTNL